MCGSSIENHHMGQHKKSTRASTNGLDAKISTALARLAKALDHANDTGRDKWDFAVEIQELRAAGLTTGDLRWLVCKGYVEHAREITLLGEDGRMVSQGIGQRSRHLLRRACGVAVHTTVRSVTRCLCFSHESSGSVASNGFNSCNFVCVESWTRDPGQPPPPRRSGIPSCAGFCGDRGQRDTIGGSLHDDVPRLALRLLDAKEQGPGLKSPE